MSKAATAIFQSFHLKFTSNGPKNQSTMRGICMYQQIQINILALFLSLKCTNSLLSTEFCENTACNIDLESFEMLETCIN